MYYLLVTRHHVLVGMIDYPSSNWGQDFNRGECLDESFAQIPVTVRLEKDHDILPDYFELDSTPIVSEIFVQLLRQLPVDNYQLYPVTIASPGGTRMDYHILNVVGRISCIDKSASTITLYDDEIVRMKKMLLREDMDKDLDMFRSEEYPLVIFLSERIARSLESSGLTGMQINPANGWSDKHRF